jgi:hypothetical protein
MRNKSLDQDLASRILILSDVLDFLLSITPLKNKVIIDLDYGK